MSTETLYHLPVTQTNGKVTNLGAYQGKVLLIVNVASQCGFTPQYQALQELYQTYENQGFAILGFPCNQFEKQEPGTNQEIADFATSCFKVTFPLFGKVDVKGPTQCALYHYLETHMRKKPLIFIPWNFTKILIDKQGRVLRQFFPFTSFKTLRKAIERELKN